MEEQLVLYYLSSKQAIKLCSIVLPLMNVLSLLEAHGEYFRVLFKMFFEDLITSSYISVFQLLAFYF